MNINRDLLQFYIYKKIIKKKQANQILEDCERLKVSVRDYMLTKEYTTEVKELPVLGGYYCLPYVEIDMLDIDKSLFDMFTFEFMKRYKIIPVSMSPEGKLLIATGNPLDCAAMSAISSQIVCPTDYVLVPPGQIDRYIDSIAVVMSTSAALNDLNTEGEAEMFSNKKAASDEDVVAENDVVNNPSVRLVDSIIREAVPYRASDIHIEPFEKVVKVRYRIDGDLQERAEFPINSYSAICARIKIMAGLDIAERRILVGICPVNTDISFSLVSILRRKSGMSEAVVAYSTMACRYGISEVRPPSNRSLALFKSSSRVARVRAIMSNSLSRAISSKYAIATSATKIICKARCPSTVFR